MFSFRRGYAIQAEMPPVERERVESKVRRRKKRKYSVLVLMRCWLCNAGETNRITKCLYCYCLSAYSVDDALERIYRGSLKVNKPTGLFTCIIYCLECAIKF